LSATATRPPRPTRAAYRRFQPIATRWNDNDVFAHVNNVVYYSWFDTAVTRFLLDTGLVDLRSTAIIGLVVETQCRYHAPVSFPDEVAVGLRVDRIGTSSVRYGIGIFRADDPLAAADGHFIHVYVDRATQRSPQPLPAAFRDALAPLLTAQA
jgi:acyl-CoA thioester hydrolase